MILGRFVLRVLFINCFAGEGELFLEVLCIVLKVPCRDVDWFLWLFSVFSLWFECFCLPCHLIGDNLSRLKSHSWANVSNSVDLNSGPLSVVTDQGLRDF